MGKQEREREGGRDRQERRGGKRQTESAIVGNVYIGEVEKILCSLTSTSDSTFL